MNKCIMCLKEDVDGNMHIYKFYSSLGRIGTKNTDKPTVHFCSECYEKLFDKERYPETFIDIALRKRV